MISLFLFLLSSTICIFSANLIQNDPVNVVDIVHKNISEIKITYLSDILVLAQTILTVTLLNMESLSEMFFIMSIAQIFRALCSFTTVLPPLKKYSEKFRFGGINGSGTEYIFSGHACYSSLSFIYLYKNDIVPLPPLLIYNLISQFSIVASKNHYTVDIILAWIIVPLLWGNVYFCLRDCYCADKIIYLLK